VVVSSMMWLDPRRTTMPTRPYPLAKPLAGNPHPIVPGAKIGHVHLKVADLDRALAFYTGVLGFELMQSEPR
jgi:catechol-2,3-dioxygenase